MNSKRKKSTAKKGGCDGGGTSNMSNEAQKEETSSSAEVKDEETSPTGQMSRSAFLKFMEEQNAEFLQCQKDLETLRAENAKMVSNIDMIKKAREHMKNAHEKREQMNQKLEEHLGKLGDAFIKAFADVALPSTGMKPTKENIQQYVRELNVIIRDEKHPYFKQAQEIIRSITTE